MKYIRALAHLFEHQHLTIVGVVDGRSVIAMTDRKLTIIEHSSVHPNATAYVPPEYIPSYKQGSIDPLQMRLELDEDGYPQLPEGTEMVTAEEEAKLAGGPAPAAEKALDIVNSLIAGQHALELSPTLHTIKDDWLAFRIKDGVINARSAGTYEGLGTAREIELANCSTDIDLCFAMPTAVLRVCRELAGESVTLGVKRTNTTFISLRTPEATIFYFCKPLNLEEPTVTDAAESDAAPTDAAALAAAAPAAETPESPENVEVAAEEPVTTGEPDAAEAQEEVAEDAVEENTAEASTPAPSEEGQQEDGPAVTGDGTGDEGGATEVPADVEPPKPKAEDVDPLEALDTLIPDILRHQDEVNRQAKRDIAILVKNVAKQGRRAFKSSTNAESITELKRAKHVAEQRAFKAEKELKELKEGLAKFKGML